MDDALVTFINILFYIVIFRFIAGIFRRKKPQKQTPQSAEQTAEQASEKPVRAERKTTKSKKKESFFEEAMKQLKKLEELADPKPKKKEKKKVRQPQVEQQESTKDQLKRDKAAAIRKENDEKYKEIYYTKGALTTEEVYESEYRLRSGDLKKAIVYAEIIGPPVSKKPGIPVRR